jgi:hypothetical protein
MTRAAIASIDIVFASIDAAFLSIGAAIASIGATFLSIDAEIVSINAVIVSIDATFVAIGTTFPSIGCSRQPAPRFSFLGWYEIPATILRNPGAFSITERRMRTAMRASVLFFCLGLQSCVWYTGDVNSAGTLQLLWTFNGGQSCNGAGVNRVVVQIYGSSYSFYCYDPISGVPGATLANVPAGTQAVTLTGYSGNLAVYSWTGPILVYGGTFNTYTIDLPYLTSGPGPGPAQSNVTFLWTFGGKTCAQAGVPNVNIVVQDPIGGNVNSVVPCTQQGVDGAVVNSFAAGTYSFTLIGLGGTGQSQFRAMGAATVNGRAPITVHVDLQPGYPPVSGTGAAIVALAFGGQSCTAAAVTQIYADLRDLNGNVASQTSVPCAGFTGSLSFVQLSGAATYYLDVVGFGTAADGGSAVLYQLTGEGLTVQPSSNSTYSLDVPPA